MATMKKTLRRSLLLLLIVFLLLCAALPGFSVVWAGGGGTPYVMNRSHDMWVDPGEDAYVFIELSEPVSSVRLEYLDDYNSWRLYKGCNCPEEDGIRWEISVRYQSFSYEGEADLRFRYEYGGYYYYSDEFTVYWDSYKGYLRIAGKNRYDTAIQIADDKVSFSGLGGYPNVIVACGTDFADALGGSYLSTYLNAPILLVNSNASVIAQVADHIDDYLLPGGGVYILGGTAAVPEAFVDALNARGISDSDITRFAGKNRYDTNLMILSFCGVYSQELLVCSGLDFADALSASPLGRPILLVGKSLTQDQKDFLNGLDPWYVDIIGGEGAVSPSVEQYIRSIGFDYARIYGKNRYETSFEVAKHFFYDYQHYMVVLAYAQNFPDGLAGGALAFDHDAPVLLVDNQRYEFAKAFVKNDDSRFAMILGGETLISDDTAKRILDID